jgi:protein deglycase
MTTLLVPLAEGFEEIEAASIIDVLRRADLQVKVASLSSNLLVKGAHGLVFQADVELSACEVAQLDGIVLPGGLPGATHLLADERLKKMLQECVAQGRCCAAICAAPQVLAAHGISASSHATCYPGVEALMGSAKMLDQGVVVDGHVITGRGIGSALDFSLAIVSYFKGPELAKKLRQAMVML